MAIFRLYMKYLVTSYTAHLNTIKKFHIHTEFAKNNHLNDPQTIFPNAIFDNLKKTEGPTIKPSNCPTPSPRL